MSILLIFLGFYLVGSYVVDRTVCVAMWRKHYRKEHERDLEVGYQRKPTAEQNRIEKRRTSGLKPNPIFPLGLLGFK